MTALGMNRTQGSGISPYRKHGKSPYRHSELFTRWREAAIRGSKDAAALGEKHSRACLGAQYDEVMAAIRRHRRHAEEYD